MSSIAVTIAGSDSGGGAGIQADLKTFSALGVYGASVITALTAQNTKGVDSIHNAPASFVEAQIQSVFSDIDVNAVKIGMLSESEIINVVSDNLIRWKQKLVVLDPVMVSTSGDRLLKAEAVNSIIKKLFPVAAIITPNLTEAAALLGEKIAKTDAEMISQGKGLLLLGAKSVLMKGGHGEGSESVDIYISQDEVIRFSAPRILTKNTHGTGCTLSSAITAGLSKGYPIKQAIDEAKIYITGALTAADELKIGHGSGPVHHFYNLWKQ